jgi:hypothetical protein
VRGAVFCEFQEGVMSKPKAGRSGFPEHVRDTLAVWAFFSPAALRHLDRATAVLCCDASSMTRASADNASRARQRLPSFFSPSR